MGLLSRMLGHASEADVEDVEETLKHALADDENVQKAFQLMRDLIVFTNRRMILIGPYVASDLANASYRRPYIWIRLGSFWLLE